jgi:hypothetical protein
MSVATTAEAKNILAVRALGQLEVANVESLKSLFYPVKEEFFDTLFS